MVAIWTQRSPATAAQREVWVAQNVDPSSPVYNIGLVVEVDGTIDVERAAAAIEASVGRVEALFVHFEVDADNQLIQVPIPDARWDVEILDLRAEADPDSTAQSWMDTDMARVFGPDDLLFRQVLLLTADDRVIWYQRYHHSVVDGYGISLIVADVAERYGRSESRDCRAAMVTRRRGCSRSGLPELSAIPDRPSVLGRTR